MTKTTPIRPARPRDDQLMLLPEIAKYVRRSENTLRWLRHQGGPDAPPLWKQGRRLVAWKSELDAWLDMQREADEAG
ncbi:helix-turn-helix transcriptional regulator [Streptosporangium saharense]|uniref:helix-turn-helix transcriptional regulator n=1 Tax=Streptosporangium saharense TaxID=1706840 RepID=UPI003430065B